MITTGKRIRLTEDEGRRLFCDQLPILGAMLRHLQYAAVLAAFLGASLGAAEVRIGDTRAAVQNNLGNPSGQVAVGERTLFYFDRGEVEMRAGVVTRVTLMSDDALAVWQTRRAEEAARLAEQRREGEGAIADKLADPAFKKSPVRSQLAFWQDFSRRYPNVPVAEQLAELRRRKYEEDRQQQETEARLADAKADGTRTGPRPIPHHTPVNRPRGLWETTPTYNGVYNANGNQGYTPYPH